MIIMIESHDYNRYRYYYIKCMFLLLKDFAFHDVKESSLCTIRLKANILNEIIICIQSPTKYKYYCIITSFIFKYN